MASPQTQDLQIKVHRSQGQSTCFDEVLNQQTNLRMMQIPSGSFLIGSPANEIGRSNSEGPQREVSLETFFLSKYPVTQAQWRFVAGLSQVSIALKINPSHFAGDNRPVEQVSWVEAVEFCDRLSAYTKRQYSLPTEAQWEYACRAGTTTSFHFGDILTPEIANFKDHTGPHVQVTGIRSPGQAEHQTPSITDGMRYTKGAEMDYLKETTPVTYYNVANGFGLCEMHGNVREWCADPWNDSYIGTLKNGNARTDGKQTERYVFRGGSWLDTSANCRSAARDSLEKNERNQYIGFRVCCIGVETSDSSTATVAKSRDRRQRKGKGIR